MEIFIETDGSKLRVKNGIFLLESFQNKMEISPVNVRAFVIKAKIAITSSAIELAIKNDVELVFINNYDKPYCRMISTEFSKSGNLRKMQYKIFSSIYSFKIAKRVLLKKSLNQKEHLLTLNFINYREKNIIDNLLLQLSENNSKKIQELMIIEAQITKFYYNVLSKNLEGNFTFENRSFAPAKDEFNSTLNYLYGILYRKVEKVLLIAGFDINTGFLHSDMKKSKSLVFDFIELFRHYAMICNYSLYRQKLIKKKYFDYGKEYLEINREGRNFLLAKFLDYLEDKELYNNKMIIREAIMQNEAYKLAEMILKISL
ncbi:MAG: CRISP-associated protein Cas1 [Fusobacteriaceae bacterium]|jgi:CRISPR-associated protein Cas1|nr:CRISP-associated protein Cas1 [Fusobacteriaceae bacterium]